MFCKQVAWPLGQHVDENVYLFKNTPVVNYVVSPFYINHIEDCCINDTKLDESYIWPLCGEVENCIMHFTNTYESNTCGTGTCFVYIQGIQRRGWFWVKTCILVIF